MTRSDPQIVLIGTLDTKSDEIEFVRDVLIGFGAHVTVIDSGILGTPTLRADISREDVAAEGGYTLGEVQKSGSRGAAVERMQECLRALARRLYAQGGLDGMLCLGGAEGALMGAAAAHALPVGVPKVIVSPSASGRREFGPFMGSSDVVVMHSVIDILGLNSVARSVFTNAAAAVYGMCTLAGNPPRGDRPSVGMTMLGQTTPGAMVIAGRLENAGYEPVIFHANGIGGPAMDSFARDGQLVGVIDFTLSEVANSLFNGIHATSPDRMTAAVDAGLPLVVVPGAGDFFNQGPLESVPEIYRSRQLYCHNPVATLVRVETAEMEQLAENIADRVNPATAPTAVIVPSQGLSLVGVPGGAIHDAKADLALIERLRARLEPHIHFEVIDDAINSTAFATRVADLFLEMIDDARDPE
jgi:uncharacterized protein (UPF0261 family)